MTRRLVRSSLVLAALVAAGCGTGDGAAGPVEATSPPTASARAPGADAAGAAAGRTTDGPVGTQPARLADRPAVEVVAPVRLEVEGIAVDAPVVPVGVAPDGSMEVPAATDVGWYRFGPAPGAEGSSVLAAHVDYDGVEGAFFRLRELGPGDRAVVVLADGSTRAFVVESVVSVPKADLTDTDVFTRDGAPRLTLITCGGEFDAAARSYEDNVVVTAVPEA